MTSHKQKAKEKEQIKHNIYETYHLSTEGYYFRYRHDKYDHNVMRATLYNRLNQRVDDVRVSAGNGYKEKSIHDIINHFEARLTFPWIK